MRPFLLHGLGEGPHEVQSVKSTSRPASPIHGADRPHDAALHDEQAMISLVFDSADALEGLSAFLRKRKARFEGR
jgi:hypothetical protein